MAACDANCAHVMW